MRAPGLGCMRLSTEPDRNEARATAALHAALDAGIEFLDTADAYCWEDAERGHNERLIAGALASWTGDRSRECCPHEAGPPRCWCRKPLPGLGVVFVKRYRLDAAQCLYIGSGPHDSGFARRLGFTFRDAVVLASGDNDTARL